jgi:hypothetical protein
MVQYESRPSTRPSYLHMDRLVVLPWHMSLAGHVDATDVDVDGLGFLIGFFVPGLAASAMNTTDETRRIEKNFIVVLDSVLMTDEIMASSEGYR